MSPVRLARLACLIAPVALFAAAPAEAGRSRSPERSPTASEEPAGAWTAGATPPACARNRRKLWQGEAGWVVKTVTTCR